MASDGFDQLDELDMSPEEYGVPHSVWRPSQLDALKYTLGEFKADNKFVVTELPTGVGKSSIATALGKDYPVLVLVHTLSLLDQYADKYGFKVVKGMDNYLCVLSDKVETWVSKYNKTPTAADCTFEKMQDCPVAEECPYLLARTAALQARRMGCTYKYASLASLVQRRPGVVILDEAHSAAEEILGSEEFVIHEYDRQRYDFPRFPFPVTYGKGGKGDHLTKSAKLLLTDWLTRCINKVAIIDEDWEPEEQQAYRSVSSKLKRILESLDEVEWFMEAGPYAIEHSGRGRHRFEKQQIPGIRLRPLSARAVADKLWHNKDHVLMMSATIGNPDPLMQELGVAEYSYKAYPHPTPAAYRPVFNLRVDRMTGDRLEANPRLYVEQAQAIAKFIHRWPKIWRGLILSSSFVKLNQIRTNLRSALGDRLATPEGVTDMREWMAAREPGSIALQTMQGWGHGIDLYGDLARMLIMAGVPFRNPTDLYERVKQAVYGANEYFWWSIYVSVPQATGRVSRGEQDDNGNWMLNVSALADGSAMTGAAQRFYPQYFKDAIVPFS